MSVDAPQRLHQRALDAFDAGDAGAAQELLRAAVAQQVDLEQLNDLAVVAAALGQTDDARLALRFAALIAPEREDVRENLAALNGLDPRATSHAPRAALPLGERVPPAVAAAPAGELLAYWRARLLQHTDDWYAGLRMLKFPEDLRIYEHVLWISAPQVVVELGTRHGGSALWFRDRLRLLESYGRITAPRVISIDIHIADAEAAIESADPAWRDTITLLEGDVCDPALAERVAALISPGAPTFVIEDSAHTYETTMGALANFAPLVTPGGFMVVEDGCVDVEPLRVQDDWPRGVLPALHEWLETDAAADFVARRDLELYGVTCHPEGFLQRVR